MQQFNIDRGGDRIVFGSGAVRTLPDQLRALGAARVLIVSTPGRQGPARMAAEALGPICAGVFAKAQPHVPAELAREARDEAKRLQADWVVAIGGGSAIGLGKAIALEFDVRLAAVPSTYAGSEMTPIYGITEGDKKTTGRDPRVRPRLVLYDPEMTADLPAAVTVSSIFNAMAHAVEALYAPDVDWLMHAAAAESIGLLAASLPPLARNPGDREARARALYGAYLSGTCLASAAMGLHHKLCHVLGGTFGLPHAQTHTVLLPHVIHFNRDAAAAAVDQVARALHTDDAAAAIYDLAARVGAPTDLRSLGLAASDLDRAVAVACEAPYQNPRPVDEAGLRALLTDALHGRRPAKTSPITAPDAPTSAPAAPVAADTAAAAATELKYLCGFGSAMQSEALPGALPRQQNSPKRVPYGLYAESINGTAFTLQRADNRRAWFYRIRPSVVQSALTRVEQTRITGRFDRGVAVPNLLRWRPLSIPDNNRAVDFVDGLATLGGAGDIELRNGLAIHLYAANADMRDRCLCNADGDLLIVPELGSLHLRTEFGVMHVAPGEIAVVQRGMKMSVTLPDQVGRGYVLEVFGAHFRLPERGPIGANGLADERHFLTPVAAYEDRDCPDYEVLVKFGGDLHRATLSHSPYDVVAWHGNYVPYKYDLAHFNAMGSVSFDHPDPSILTVLSSPLDDHGNNVADFIAFPGRWDVSEHTFRPPYFHRNIATEFSGIVKMKGRYNGFEKGGYFLTPTMTPHGVGTPTYRNAIEAGEQPMRMSDDQLWIMFESALGIRLTPWALEPGNLDDSYLDLFKDMPKDFSAPK